ncbi:hypothetical protein EB796_011794 [Bugula neritina]|uniref:Uncharacterized protein n=1 Tax=Bugula neritina TaxID=10212 RepID=A0A7J7JVL1_BUGNE|nr:hypothetical protein EB796_011794 [Bugula neritina]
MTSSLDYRLPKRLAGPSPALLRAMSLASGRMDYDSSHSTSKETGLSSGRYSNCYYHHGRYCCSKICTIVVLLLFTTLAGVAMGSLSLWLDNWAGISTNPYATLDLKYPRLGSKHLDYVMFNKTIPNDDGTLYKYIDNGGKMLDL